MSRAEPSFNTINVVGVTVSHPFVIASCSVFATVSIIAVGLLHSPNVSLVFNFLGASAVLLTHFILKMDYLVFSLSLVLVFFVWSFLLDYLYVCINVCLLILFMFFVLFCFCSLLLFSFILNLSFLDLTVSFFFSSFFSSFHDYASVPLSIICNSVVPSLLFSSWLNICLYNVHLSVFTL